MSWIEAGSGGSSDAARVALLEHVRGDLEIPTLPDVAIQVHEASRADDCDVERLAELVARDPGLTAYLLRVANSASFAPSMPILSIRQCILRVGLKGVGDMAFLLGVGQRLFSTSGRMPLMRTLWRHSVATACYAREIAGLLRLDLDSAFLCGLLHDVGMALALRVLSDLERDPDFPVLTDEQCETLLRECHCELGAILASSWKLGPWIGLVIRHHHEPERANYHPHEVPIVALADQLAEWAVDERLREDDFHAPRGLLNALGLHEGALATLLGRRSRVLAQVEDLT